MADGDRGLEQWFGEHRAEFQARADAEISSWMKSEMPNYLAACGGNSTEEGFIAYVMDKLSNADPELQARFTKAFIGSTLAQTDPANPNSTTVMTSTELLKRLGMKPDGGEN
jgi:hypothetical protein